MSDIGLERPADAGTALFANADWRVIGDGLEHRGTGYFIAAQALAARRADGFWEWPLHLSEKSWCAPRPFREAFVAALDHFGIARDEGLTRSFALALGSARGGGAKDGFVALADLVRPKSAQRKRPAAGEPRQAARNPAPTRARVTAAAGA